MATQDAGANPAIIGHILAHRPDVEQFFKYVQQLRQDYRSGRLTVPATIDLSDLAPEDAELAAAFVMAVRGVTE